VLRVDGAAAAELVASRNSLQSVMTGLDRSDVTPRPEQSLSRVQDVLVGVAVQDRLHAQLLRGFLASQLGLDAVVVRHDLPPGDRAPHVAVLVVSGSQLGGDPGPWGRVPRLVWLGQGSAQEMAEALRAGATGVVDDSAGLTDIADAVLAVARGQSWLPPARVSEVLAVLSDDRGRTAQAAVAGLSRREREVLHLVGQGLTRREIAAHLVVSPHTARTHVQNLMLKLDVHSQVALAAASRRLGRLVEP
jgi:DNA-binding NarL/FixJ family response regulator